MEVVLGLCDGSMEISRGVLDSDVKVEGSADEERGGAGVERGGDGPEGEDGWEEREGKQEGSHGRAIAGSMGSLCALAGSCVQRMRGARSESDPGARQMPRLPLPHRGNVDGDDHNDHTGSNARTGLVAPQGQLRVHPVSSRRNSAITLWQGDPGISLPRFRPRSYPACLRIRNAAASLCACSGRI